MPLLPREPNLFPDDLLSGPATLGAGKHWWVAQTISRQEKVLARHLCANSIPFYLPLVTKKKKVNGRKRVSLIPLFTGYAFFFGDEGERIAALTSNAIVNLIDVPNTEEMTFDLCRLEKSLTSGAEVSLETKLEPGRPVRITSGSLMGFEAVVISRRGGDRLLVAVRFLQQGVSLLIDDYQVEPI